MGAKGRNMVLYVGDDTSPGNFTLVAGLQSTGLSISNSPIDITNIDSDEHRELHDGGYGDRNYSLSGSGIFLDDAIIQQIEDAVQAASRLECQLVFENGDFYQGFFMVTSFEKSGGFSGVITYSIALEGASQIQFSRSTAALLAACATSWAAGGAHPGGNAGATNAEFNGSEGSPRYLICGGTPANVAYSTDNGASWTLGTLNAVGASSHAWGLAFSGTAWIITGWDASFADDYIERSTSGGVSWTDISYTPTDARQANTRVIYGNGRFLVTAFNTNHILISTDDGLTFSESGALGVSAVNWLGLANDGGNNWLAISTVGVVYLSTDNGSTWAATGGNSFTANTDVIWDPENNWWIASGTDRIETSPDGITWTERYNDATNRNIHRLQYSTGGCYMATGDSGLALQSTDAITWSPVTTGISGSLQGLSVSFVNWLITTGSAIRLGTP